MHQLVLRIVDALRGRCIFPRRGTKFHRSLVASDSQGALLRPKARVAVVFADMTFSRVLVSILRRVGSECAAFDAISKLETRGMVRRRPRHRGQHLVALECPPPCIYRRGDPTGRHRLSSARVVRFAPFDPIKWCSPGFDRMDVLLLSFLRFGFGLGRASKGVEGSIENIWISWPGKLPPSDCKMDHHQSHPSRTKGWKRRAPATVRGPFATRLQESSSVPPSTSDR